MSRPARVKHATSSSVSEHVDEPVERRDQPRASHRRYRGRRKGDGFEAGLVVPFGQLRHQDGCSRIGGEIPDTNPAGSCLAPASKRCSRRIPVMCPGFGSRSLHLRRRRIARTGNGGEAFPPPLDFPDQLGEAPRSVAPVPNLHPRV
jgi:hypothetical protein